MQNTGRTGSMTLKIKIASASKGGGDVDKITIMADRKLELPKPEQPQDFFWLTDSAEPTRQHPRQHSLDLRDAQDNRGGIRQAQATGHIVNALTTTDADGVTTFKEDQVMALDQQPTNFIGKSAMGEVLQLTGMLSALSSAATEVRESGDNMRHRSEGLHPGRHFQKPSKSPGRPRDARAAPCS